MSNNPTPPSKPETITMSEWMAALNRELDAASQVYQVRKVPWSKEEVDLVRKWMGRVPNQKLASLLKRTYKSVKDKIHDLRKNASEEKDNIRARPCRIPQPSKLHH